MQLTLADGVQLPFPSQLPGGTLWSPKQLATPQLVPLLGIAQAVRSPPLQVPPQTSPSLQR